MNVREALLRATGAVIAAQIAIFRQDQPVLVIVALALFALLAVDTFRNPVPRARRD